MLTGRKGFANHDGSSDRIRLHWDMFSHTNNLFTTVIRRNRLVTSPRGGGGRSLSCFAHVQLAHRSVFMMALHSSLTSVYSSVLVRFQ